MPAAGWCCVALFVVFFSQSIRAQRVDFNSYPEGPLASATPGVSNKSFDGWDGWSESCGASGGVIVPSSASGEYPGSGRQLRGSGAADAYIGAKEFIPFDPLSQGMSFEVRAATNASVTTGLWFDADDDFRYDLSETQMQAGLVIHNGALIFGIQGITGTVFSSGISPLEGAWYRIVVVHGAANMDGARMITVRVRDLTTGVELDFDPVAAGVQPWRVTVSPEDFGVGSGEAHGLAVRVTGAEAAIDNIGTLSYAKDGNNLLPLSDSNCWVERFVPGPGDIARADQQMSSSFRNSPLGATMEIGGFQSGNNLQTWRIAGTAGAILSIGAAGIDVQGPDGGLQFGCDVRLTADQEWHVRSVSQFIPGLEFNVYSNYPSPTLDLAGFTATKTGPEDLWIRGGYDLSDGTLVCAEGRLSLSSGGTSGDMILASNLTLRAENGGMLSINNTGGGVTSSSALELDDGELNIGLDFVLHPLTLSGPFTVSGDSKLTFFSSNVVTTTGVRLSLTGPLLGSGTLWVNPSSMRPYADRIRLEGNNSGFTGRVVLDATAGNRTLQLRNAQAGSAGAKWEIAAGNTLEIHGAAASLGRLEGQGVITNSHPSNPAIAVIGEGEFAGTLANGNAPLALTKIGPGTLVISGTQSFSGDTTVLAGRLRCAANNSLSDTAAVRLGAEAVLELDFNGTDAVAKLSIDGTDQPAGQWGAPGSGAANTNPQLAGTGFLLVGSGNPNPYQEWLAGYQTLTGPADTAPDADPDGDGIANFLEWILAGDPTQLDGASLISVTTGTGLALGFSRAAASVGQATLAVEWTNDLALWKRVPIGAVSSGPDAYGVTVTIDTASTPHQVTVSIPAANAPGGRLFARLVGEY